jgi:hypothetical protein
VASPITVLKQTKLVHFATKTAILNTAAIIQKNTLVNGSTQKSMPRQWRLESKEELIGLLVVLDLRAFSGRAEPLVTAASVGLLSEN